MCTCGCDAGVIGDAGITGDAAVFTGASSSSDSSTGMDPGSMKVLRAGTDAALPTAFFRLDLMVLEGTGVSVSPSALPLIGGAVDGRLIE